MKHNLKRGCAAVLAVAVFLVLALLCGVTSEDKRLLGPEHEGPFGD